MFWDKGLIRSVNKILHELGGVAGELPAKRFVDSDHSDRKKCDETSI